jgi:DNA-binding response OmpR family regulator
MEKTKILILENNKTTLYFLKKGFQSAGFDIYTAESCIEALKSIKENKFDLLLLDYFLNDGTAFDICKKARAEKTPLKIPIVIFSGQPELIGDSIKKCQADLFIQKDRPCSMVVLAVKTLLRRIAWERAPEQETLKL